MSFSIQVVSVILISYLIGAIPFGFLIARWRGVNIIQQGSGNIGATNVGRVLGKRFGILVFLLDFSKGAVPVLIARAVADWSAPNSDANSLKVAAGLAAFVGHIFPVFLSFRGGKGVATGAGVVAVLLPWPALGAVLTWIAILCAFRYVSLASLAAAVILCGLHLLETVAPFAGDKRMLTLFCFVAAGLIFLRHRANIVRLVQGTENRVKESAAMLQLTKIIHVLALGLWFGSAAFFILIVAPVIFFEAYSPLAQPGAERPPWLPDSFDQDKASQLAGIAVAPIFPRFFLLQGICGFLAIAPALAWTRAETQRTNKLRFYVLSFALITVLVGWPLAQKVSALRLARYSADTALAATARADFAIWHLFSLLLSFVTLALVTVAMALAANLPTNPNSVASGKS